MVEKLRLKIILVALFILFIILPIIFLTLTMKKKGKSGVPSENKTQMTLDSQGKPVAFPTVTPKEKKIQSISIPDSQATFGDKSFNLTIAANILSWLDSTKDESGVYRLGTICETDKKCDSSIKDNRVGLAAVWGRFKYYERTKDKKQWDTLNKDIAVYADKVDPIQNDFWNCKLMYELWRNNDFSSVQKQKIKQICDKSTHDLPALIKIEEKIKAGDIKEINLDSVMKGGFITTESFIDKDKFIIYSSAASDYITHYLWNGNNADDLKKATQFFNLAVQVYTLKKPETSFFEGEWLLAVTSLDFYKALKKSAYLDFALYMSRSKNKDSCPSVFSCLTKSLFYHELYNLTKNVDYKNQRDGSLQKIIDIGYDIKGGYGYFLDKKAVRSFNLGAILYLTRDNGLVVGLLSSY